MSNQQGIIELLQNEFVEYAAPILINNLPSIDGLLPVNRKVIWALHKNNITHSKPFIKMLRASSFAMVFYTFGDMPLTSAMKNMGNNTLNYTYLLPKGSFGDKRKENGVGAAPRYIECKLSEYSEDMLQGINKQNVSFKRNFDNTEDEPIVLPSLMPNILINNSQSIAVGESSKIPSHNLIEVCDSFISYIKTQDIEKSIGLLNGVDFSIGGQIINDRDTFGKIYKTGRGSFTVLGNYEYDAKENKISIIEVPYETYIETIEKKIREKYESGVFREIIDIHNGSDRKGIKLDIYLKKNTNIDHFITKLRKHTPYESKISCNFTILDLDGKTPKLMSLEDIIQRWLKHRYSCIVKEFEYDLQQKNSELHRLYGLKAILNQLDETIEIIRKSKNETNATEKLIKRFLLTKEQANYIATIRIININEEWISKKISAIDKIEEEIKYINSIINDKQAIDNIIIEQLEYAKKKYGQPRYTKLIEDHDITNVSEDELIPDYSVTMIFTKEQYLKKTLRYAYADKQKIKENDRVLQIIQSSNRGETILLSNLGNAYKIQINDLQEKQPSAMGEYLPSLLSLEPNEQILGMLSTSDFKGRAIIVYENGKISKVCLDSYQTKTKRTKLQNSLNLESPVVAIFQANEDIDLFIKSNQNKAIIVNTKDISEKSSRNTQGITFMKSNKEDFKVTEAKIYDGSLDDTYRTNKACAGKLL